MLIFFILKYKILHAACYTCHEREHVSKKTTKVLMVHMQSFFTLFLNHLIFDIGKPFGMSLIIQNRHI